MKRIDEPDVHPMEREAILRIRPCGVYESDETTIIVLRAFAQQVALATIEAYERQLISRLPGAQKNVVTPETPSTIRECVAKSFENSSP